RAAARRLPRRDAQALPGGVRVSPRELVRRRHLRGAAPERRGAVHRRERKAGDAARGDGEMGISAIAPRGLRQRRYSRMGKTDIGATMGTRVRLFQTRGRGQGDPVWRVIAIVDVGDWHTRSLPCYHLPMAMRSMAS